MTEEQDNPANRQSTDGRKYAKLSLALGILAISPFFIFWIPALCGAKLFELHGSHDTIPAIPAFEILLISLPCVSIFATIGALFFGATALSKLGMGTRKEKQWAVSGILLGLLMICVMIVGMFLPSNGQSAEKGRRISCGSNLKQIGLALKQYAQDNKGYLPSPGGEPGLALLRKNNYISDSKILVCPSAKNTAASKNQVRPENAVDYVYAGVGLSLNDSPDSPIAWDKPNNHNNYGTMLFLDGRVTGYPGSNWLKTGQRTAPGEK